ncbi:MAG: Asp-tRNA(Asn)/Glu-tRNA(Gln) amidotransferase subunit GatA [Acidobacteriota bacterium]|nr:MAG: Asp-tRNA(Asn)/Glu-tRNA(Gln) amidotransferase subunit GatA [Acidobacteriota bacterium]
MSLVNEIQRTLDTAETLNTKLNAFISIERGHAEAQAQELDRQTERGPLNGMAIAVKDNICTKGMPTTCGSRILGNYHAQYDATAVARLQDAGGIVVGKTNMDEFAMGSSNESSAFGPAKNPWDIERVPGGSSGGSAAAVAAGMVPAALGSETGGSVRQPASLCGIIGLKPTYGRISRFGLVAFASSLDNIGIFGRDVKDVAGVLKSIAGRDPKDSTSADVPVPDYPEDLEKSLEGKIIGIPRSLLGEGLDDEIRSSVLAAAERFASMGARLIDIDLPHVRYGIAVYYIIATAEASSNLARYDGVRYGFRAEEAYELRQMYMKTREKGFGPEVKRRIMLGTYVLSSGYYDAYYAKAQKVRALIKQDHINAFERCDAILTPTSPSTAFRLGERSDDPLAMYLSDIYTVSANLAGVPAISVPCGLSSDGLPIGVQLTCDFWKESTMLNLAHKYQTEFPLEAKPSVFAGDLG